VHVFEPDVFAVLEESQRLGFLGDRDISEVIEHARAFVDALDGIRGTVADLGSGGGVPGLVIAHDRPDLTMMLVDRRSKRTDFLDRMVRRLRWNDRVTVICSDVEDFIATAPTIDAAVARGFGPPEVTLNVASRLVRAGGRVVISEPPQGERWPKELIAELGVCRVDDDRGSVSIFENPPVDGFT
jgi:16S rRNA (guanine527-N7)-methyltransferase